MIQSGTLLIQTGTKLPSSVSLTSDAITGDWTSVEDGVALHHLKAELASAGWTYFYMGALRQNVLGTGPKRVDLAMQGITDQMRLNDCNSVQIDAITTRSLLGIPYTTVSAHYCHIQESMLFSGRTE